MGVSKELSIIGVSLYGKENILTLANTKKVGIED